MCYISFATLHSQRVPTSVSSAKRGGARSRSLERSSPGRPSRRAPRASSAGPREPAGRSTRKPTTPSWVASSQWCTGLYTVMLGYAYVHAYMYILHYIILCYIHYVISYHSTFTGARAWRRRRRRPSPGRGPRSSRRGRRGGCRPFIINTINDL